MGTQLAELSIYLMGNNNLFFDMRIPGENFLYKKVSQQIKIYDSTLKQLCVSVAQTVNSINEGNLGQTTGVDAFRSWGETLYRYLLGERRLQTVKDEFNRLSTPLLISVPKELSVPWELLHNGEEFLGIKHSIGRVLQSTDTFPIITPIKKEPLSRCLFIVNPTSEPELANVEEHAQDLSKWLREKGIDCTVLAEEEAELTEVLRQLSSGKYDIIHYCGHVRYVGDNELVMRNEKGGEYALILHDHIPLRASEIERQVEGVTLAFINGCESAVGIESLTRAFIEKGTRLVVGTIYQVPSNGARVFAEKFYNKFLEGEDAGESFRFARQITQNRNDCGPAWTAFVLYGNPNFQLGNKIPKKLGETVTIRPCELDLPDWLQRNHFDNSCWRIIEDCMESARTLGVVATPHLFTAMLSGEIRELREAFDSQNISPGKLKEAFQEAIRLSGLFTGKSKSKLTFTDNTKNILIKAQEIATAENRKLTDQHDLLRGFIEQGGGSVGEALQRLFGIDLQTITQQAEQSALGPLEKEDFDPSGWFIINQSIRTALHSGSNCVGTPHLLLALLKGKEKCAFKSLSRSVIPPGLLKRLFEVILARTSRTKKAEPISPSTNVENIFKLAKELADGENGRKITEKDLWEAFIQQGGGQAGDILLEYLNIDLQVLNSAVFSSSGSINENLFDDNSKMALSFAIQYGRDHCQNEVLTPHIIIGLCSIQGGITQSLLLEQGLDSRDVQKYLAESFKREQGALSDYHLPTKPLLTLRLRRILDGAYRLSQLEKCEQIEEKHILLAFLREGGGATAEALRKLGVNLERMENNIEKDAI